MSAPYLSAYAKVAALASQQWGLITSKQAAGLDVSAINLARWTQQGALIRLAQGIYKTAGNPVDHRDAVCAAWLGLDPARTAAQRCADRPIDAVVSHHSAARIHRLGQTTTELHEFTVHGRRQSRRRDVRIHLRTAPIAQEHWTCVDGLPVTTVTQTVVDLAAANISSEELGPMVRDAITTGTADTEELSAILSPHADRYNEREGDGAAVLRRLLAAAEPPSQLGATDKIPLAELAADQQVAWLVATVAEERLRAAVALLDRRRP